MSIDTKLLVPSHNITPRAPLNYGSVTWILNQKETQKWDVAQMHFWDHYWTSLD
jgi:hypothetical protein